MLHVLVQVRATAAVREAVPQTPRDGDDGRERVVDLVAEHADEPLPRLPLLLAKRAAQVGQHEEPMREPALAELRGARLPPAFPAGKAEVGRARTVRREGLFQSERRRVEPEETLGRTSQDPLPRAVHETQAPLVIEDEDRGLDLLHHLAQERRRVERAEALLTQRLP